jgi:hypothetical protein
VTPHREQSSPRQLPPIPVHFISRVDGLAGLDTLITEVSG